MKDRFVIIRYINSNRQRKFVEYIYIYIYTLSPGNHDLNANLQVLQLWRRAFRYHLH
jgi:hypothetical protein